MLGNHHGEVNSLVIFDERSYEKWWFNGLRNGDMNGIYPLVI